MTAIEHENYAQNLLSSLSDHQPEVDPVEFVPDRTKSKNAANAITAILCHRLAKKNGHLPTRKANKNFEWNDGIFNNRNNADRDSLFTNMLRSVADKMHKHAMSKPAAYLMAFSNPSDTTLCVWAIPEPLLHSSLSGLRLKEGGREYYIQIFTKTQRFEHHAASPDLAPCFQEFSLSQQELLALTESRKVDSSVKKERAIARGDESPSLDDGDEDATEQSDTNMILATLTQQMADSGVFDASGITDARERVLSSIVRRRGQPAFREQLLTAYNGRCAISGCEVEAVLEAAHIVPYMGPKTNHPGNGLLLRADLHTLFDLGLIAIDPTTMCVLIASSLESTGYKELRGRPITIPDDPLSQPSREALGQHRKDSGL